MKENPLKRLESLGQSIWLDYISRDLVESDALSRLIEEDGLCGITSNPAIFEKSISGSHDYDDDIRTMSQMGKDIKTIYESLSQNDVQDAADELRSVFDETEGRDGFVSLEVNPHLAHDTQGTIEEARRLWAKLKRPNVLIKVPGTSAGLPAIRQLISEGINVNVTLLFGLPRYREVAEAYIEGLEERAYLGKTLTVSSVASFFISRIDTLIDPLLEQHFGSDSEKAKLAKEIHGQVGIASAKIAYQIYKEIFEGRRFKKLLEIGARPQRALWASTSTKNPEYSDVKYVEALIGKNTVNTLPMETLEAYRNHGEPQLRLETELDKAQQVLKGLAELGIDLDMMTQQLEDEGVKKFNQPFDKLMEALKSSRKVLMA